MPSNIEKQKWIIIIRDNGRVNNPQKQIQPWGASPKRGYLVLWVLPQHLDPQPASSEVLSPEPGLYLQPDPTPASHLEEWPLSLCHPSPASPPGQPDLHKKTMMMMLHQQTMSRAAGKHKNKLSIISVSWSFTVIFYHHRHKHFLLLPCEEQSLSALCRIWSTYKNRSHVPVSFI